MKQNTSNTQTSIEEATNSNSSSTSRYELVQKLDNSPLDIIEGPEGFFIAMGNERLTDLYPTKDQLLLHTDTWEFKFTVMSSIAQFVYQFNLNTPQWPTNQSIPKPETSSSD